MKASPGGREEVGMSTWHNKHGSVNWAVTAWSRNTRGVRRVSGLEGLRQAAWTTFRTVHYALARWAITTIER
jgi:hypothetical protein